MWIIQSKYDMNNSIRVVIIDGWDKIASEQRRYEIWCEFEKWRKYHKNIKVIITSRYMEERLWGTAYFSRLQPFSQEEAMDFLKIITRDDSFNEKIFQRSVNIFNTPLMLKMYAMAINQLGMIPEEATLENFLFSYVTRYSKEESWTLENLAFRMMQEDKMFVALEDNSNLMHLSYYAELCIQDGKVAFSHKIFYELFAAMYIVHHIINFPGASPQMPQRHLPPAQNAGAGYSLKPHFVWY